MDLLARECATFCRHLIGQRPDEYVVAKYKEYHRLPVARKELEARAWDRTLLVLAGLHPAMTRLADAHTRIFSPHSVLRKKLILLLAILETRAPFHQCMELGGAQRGAGLYTRLALALLLAGGLCLVSAVALLPLYLLVRMVEAAARVRLPARRVTAGSVGDGAPPQPVLASLLQGSHSEVRL